MGHKSRVFDGVEWIRRAAFRNDMIDTIHFIVPRAPVPMVITGKVEHSRTLYIQSDILVVGQLI
jgi:hypothetical protein